MKRFGLTGSDGYWGQYVEEYDTLSEAKLAALYWLDRGYDAMVWDQETSESWDLVKRYDGLGVS